MAVPQSWGKEVYLGKVFGCLNMEETSGMLLLCIEMTVF